VDTYNERWEKECKKQEADRLDRERQLAHELQAEEEERAKIMKDKVSQYSHRFSALTSMHDLDVLVAN
jgi:hypothetical protein